MRLTDKQMQALREYGEGREHPSIDDFMYGDGVSPIAWRNRERVIEALMRRGLIDASGITQAGRDVLDGRQVNTDALTETQFAALVK